ARGGAGAGRGGGWRPGRRGGRLPDPGRHPSSMAPPPKPRPRPPPPRPPAGELSGRPAAPPASRSREPRKRRWWAGSRRGRDCRRAPVRIGGLLPEGCGRGRSVGELVEEEDGTVALADVPPRGAAMLSRLTALGVELFRFGI